MLCFRLLSTPVSELTPSYRGLYRNEPYPQPSWDADLFELWHKYTSYLGTGNEGITDEMSLDEMRRFEKELSLSSKHSFEIVCISDEYIDLSGLEYLGADIVGAGGYSLIGDVPEDYSGNMQSCKIYRLLYDSKDYLNKYGLIGTLNKANEILKMACTVSDNSLENEDWHIVHLYSL